MTNQKDAPLAMLTRMRDWIAREVPIGTESATYWVIEIDRLLSLYAQPQPTQQGGAEEIEVVARLMCRQHYGDRGYATPGILNVVESDWSAWKDKAAEVLAALNTSEARG